jgi:hypothetical protein
VKPRVLNFYAGPGTGKSTTATAVFSELKQLGINCEVVFEYAKDATWERRGEKVFKAQEYIFGKQHFRMARVADEVDIVITDSPILLGLVYTDPDFGMPSLAKVTKEAFGLYDNLDVFLERNKPYNPKGRNQTLEQAIKLDGNIKQVLAEMSPNSLTMPYGRSAVTRSIREMAKRWGKEIPALHDFVPNFQPVLTRVALPMDDEAVNTHKGVIAWVRNGKWFSEGLFVYEAPMPAPKWWMPIINDEDVLAA